MRNASPRTSRDDSRTAGEAVHGFTAGVYVTVATGCLFVLISIAGLLAERRRTQSQRQAGHDRSTVAAIEIEADRLEQAA